MVSGFATFVTVWFGMVCKQWNMYFQFQFFLVMQCHFLQQVFIVEDFLAATNLVRLWVSEIYWNRCDGFRMLMVAICWTADRQIYNGTFSQIHFMSIFPLVIERDFLSSWASGFCKGEEIWVPTQPTLNWSPRLDFITSKTLAVYSITVELQLRTCLVPGDYNYRHAWCSLQTLIFSNYFGKCLNGICQSGATDKQLDAWDRPPCDWKWCDVDVQPDLMMSVSCQWCYSLVQLQWCGVFTAGSVGSVYAYTCPLVTVACSCWFPHATAFSHPLSTSSVAARSSPGVWREWLRTNNHHRHKQTTWRIRQWSNHHRASKQCDPDRNCLCPHSGSHRCPGILCPENSRLDGHPCGTCSESLGPCGCIS